MTRAEKRIYDLIAELYMVDGYPARLAELYSASGYKRQTTVGFNYGANKKPLAGLWI